MNEQDRHSRFSQLIARHQSELYAYIYAIVRNWENADDLYQATCLVLWRKFETFRPDSSFFAWARETAKLEARSFLRRKQSPSYVNEELLDALADIALDARDDDVDVYLSALRRCKEKLGAEDAELLQLRYVEDLGTHDIADRLQRFQSNVCKSLNRIRRRLLECVRLEIARQDHSGGTSHE
jgi:RNA polymerase sigma-70 factor (ECF subfamily)